MSAKLKREKEWERKKGIVQIVCRFYFENLFNKDDKTMKIANNSNDIYREKIAFFVNKYQDVLK